MLLTAGRRRVAVLVHRRTAVVTVTLLAGVFALAVLSTAVGTRLLPVSDVLTGLAGTADRAVNLTVRDFRLPRTAVAVLVGMALGVSGALTQALTRNPLASPDVLGVVNGASAGAVAVLITAGGATAGYGGATATLSQVGVPLGAVAGAVVCRQRWCWASPRAQSELPISRVRPRPHLQDGTASPHDRG